MAEVYGRLTRRPGVMIGQGPWVLGNGLIGTIEAFLSSSAMLLLTDFSDATRFHLQTPYQQATGDYGSWDARRAFSGVTKQVIQAHEPIAAVQATQLAIRHALAGRPRPVAVLFALVLLSCKIELPAIRRSLVKPGGSCPPVGGSDGSPGQQRQPPEV
jgi:acetolactate synthase-1/2/3 large subunit